MKRQYSDFREMFIFRHIKRILSIIYKIFIERTATVHTFRKRKACYIRQNDARDLFIGKAEP